MIVIISFIIVVFSIAGIAGLLLYRSSVWNYVDVLYYPLAAVSVVLVFASNTAERQIFELSRVIDKHKYQIEEIVAKKPIMQAMSNGELIEASFHLVATISALNSVCTTTTKSNPNCKFADKMNTSVDTFLKATQVKYPTPELRLYGVCSAVDRFLLDTRRKGQISTLIGDEIIAQYQSTFAKGYQPLDYGIVVAEALGFEQRALGRIESLRQVIEIKTASRQSGFRHVALYDKDQPVNTLLSLHKSEIDFGKLLLQRLYPCFVSPKQDFELLAQWVNVYQQEQNEIDRLERERRHIKDSHYLPPLLLWLNLSLWPIVLVLALSLKFAKGIAIARLARTQNNRRRNG